jgi:hypothetical protein
MPLFYTEYNKEKTKQNTHIRNRILGQRRISASSAVNDLLKKHPPQLPFSRIIHSEQQDLFKFIGLFIHRLPTH